MVLLASVQSVSVASLYSTAKVVEEGLLSQLMSAPLDVILDTASAETG